MINDIIVRKAQTLKHGKCVNSVAFSPDGRLLASGSWDKTVQIWQVYPEDDEEVQLSYLAFLLGKADGYLDKRDGKSAVPQANLTDYDAGFRAGQEMRLEKRRQEERRQDSKDRILMHEEDLEMQQVIRGQPWKDAYRPDTEIDRVNEIMRKAQHNPGTPDW